LRLGAADATARKNPRVRVDFMLRILSFYNNDLAKPFYRDLLGCVT
jgi:hypothetical protein